MDKPIIIGTGFSGLIVYLFLGKKAIVYGINLKYLTTNKKNVFLLNKIFGPKAKSQTMLSNKLVNINLHDRLISGGNGTIWGGFFLDEGLNEYERKLFTQEGICLIELSYKTTGSFSPNKKIKQLQNINKKIINPSDYIDINENKYLRQIEVTREKSIKCYWLTEDGKHSITFHSEYLFLAIGVVQLIDLLYKSKFINENDVLKMNEYSYSVKIIFKFNSKKNESEVIRFSFIRGILHFLGINFYPKFISYFDLIIPIIFEQSFGPEKFEFKFIVKDNALINVNHTNKINFGKSIHYCNLRINNTPISEFLNIISPRIIGVGMAFVNQRYPGPISSDIFKQLSSEVSFEKF